MRLSIQGRPNLPTTPACDKAQRHQLIHQVGIGHPCIGSFEGRRRRPMGSAFRKSGDTTAPRMRWVNPTCCGAATPAAEEGRSGPARRSPRKERRAFAGRDPTGAYGGSGGPPWYPAAGRLQASADNQRAVERRGKDASARMPVTPPRRSCAGGSRRGRHPPPQSAAPGIPFRTGIPRSPR